MCVCRNVYACVCSVVCLACCAAAAANTNRRTYKHTHTYLTMVATARHHMCNTCGMLIRELRQRIQHSLNTFAAFLRAFPVRHNRCPSLLFFFVSIFNCSTEILLSTVQKLHVKPLFNSRCAFWLHAYL